MDDLVAFAEEHGIAVEVLNLPCNLSVSVQLDCGCFVGIDSSLLFRPMIGQVYLAHELGHCFTGSFYNPYSPLDIRSKHEYRADKWAIEALIPRSRLEEALASGLTEVWELAEWFNLPCEFTYHALAYYQRQKGC